MNLFQQPEEQKMEPQNGWFVKEFDFLRRPFFRSYSGAIWWCNLG